MPISHFRKPLKIVDRPVASMTQHPWPGSWLLRVEDAEFGFLGAGRPDFRAAATTAATRVGGADGGFVAAFFHSRQRPCV